MTHLRGFYFKEDVRLRREHFRLQKVHCNRSGSINWLILQLLLQFECCGVDNSSEWIYSKTKFNKVGNHQFVPDSCCKDETKGCGNLIKESRNVFKDKIYQKVGNKEIALIMYGKHYMPYHQTTYILSTLISIHQKDV